MAITFEETISFVMVENAYIRTIFRLFLYSRTLKIETDASELFLLSKVHAKFGSL